VVEQEVVLVLEPQEVQAVVLVMALIALLQEQLGKVMLVEQEEAMRLIGLVLVVVVLVRSEQLLLLLIVPMALMARVMVVLD
jgi:hypothetical protein